MASYEQMTSVLPRQETLAVREAPASYGIGEWAEGQRVGPFRLVRRLGKGGMGQVWLAHQLQPLIRDVALKVMLPERRSARAEAFFEVERQALAQLSHRAIAQIYDAGRLPDGALFFAMEYVPGRPLDDYLQLNPLPLITLVRMFIELCNGMQHAHQRGLIHRDLKPQNILVQDTEAGPLPRIIDFGIALGASADGPTPMQAHLIAGTPAYMSPEQRRADDQGIDARCDIYALGVMLAECLRQHVGLPFDSRAPEGTALREEFARSLDSQGTVSGEAATLRRAPFELRSIALKALADDREQRYASAASMAEDLQRWQRREPVLAVQGGRRYELRCFLQRNALATAAASLIGLALVGGTGLALYGLTEAREGRAQAEAAQALAEQRRGEAEQLIQYMLGDFADKLRPLGRLDLLDGIGSEALKYLGETDGRGTTASHLARARALRTLGEVQVTRQQFEQAAPILEQAARLLSEALVQPEDSDGELHFEAGQVAFWQGQIAYWRGDIANAQAHWENYMRHAQAFASRTRDWERGQQELAYAYNNLGTAEFGQHRVDDALRHFLHAATIRRTTRLASNEPATLELVDTLSWIGQAQSAAGLPHDALGSYDEALMLVSAYVQDKPQDASARRYEINLRYVTSQILMDLDRREEAASQLRIAMRRASEDVELDPVQPRRQAMLAHIAFNLARLDSVESSLRIQALQIGSQALRVVESSALSAQERLHVLAIACVAKLSLRQGGDCVQQLDVRARQVDRYTEAIRLLHPIAELSALSTPIPTGLRELAREIDETVSPERGRSLRHLLTRLALLDPSSPPAEREDLELKITAMRVTPSNGQEKTP